MTYTSKQARLETFIATMRGRRSANEIARAIGSRDLTAEDIAQRMRGRTDIVIVKGETCLMYQRKHVAKSKQGYHSRLDLKRREKLVRQKKASKVGLFLKTVDEAWEGAGLN